jgi:hypothetical protein
MGELGSSSLSTGTEKRRRSSFREQRAIRIRSAGKNLVIRQCKWSRQEK